MSSVIVHVLSLFSLRALRARPESIHGGAWHAILRQQAQPVLLRGTAHPRAQTSVRAGEPFAQSERAIGAAQQELIGWQLKKPARHPGCTSWLPSICIYNLEVNNFDQELRT